jgi:AcrR family transcriptional regulator
MVVGRRPGKRDTRADIMVAARAAFVEEGYDRPSLRSIARRAGVDPALIHHYFDGKAGLFAEVMKIGIDPREIVSQRADGTRDGADLVRSFLTLWERGRPWGGGQAPFMTACQAVTVSPEAAAGLREYLQERVFSQINCEGEDRSHRQALVTSQLMGLAFVRYVLRMEPVASAPVEAVVGWVGPTLDRYMRGDLETPPDLLRLVPVAEG